MLHFIRTSIIDLSFSLKKWQTPYTLIFGIFSCLCLFYYSILAAPQYISKATIIIKQQHNSNTTLQPFSLISPAPDSSYKDALLLKEYIYSFNLLKHLNEKFNLQKHYTITKWDPLLALNKKASKEDFLKYYRKKITIHCNADSNIIKIQYRDVQAALAQRILFEIINQSEVFINQIATNLAKNQLEFAHKESMNTKQTLQKKKEQLQTMQNRYKFLTPEREASSISQIISDLELQLSHKKIELKRLQTFLSNNSFKVIDLQNQINTIKEQILKEQSKLAGKGLKINDLQLQYDYLILEVKFLEESYSLSLEALKKAQIQAISQLKHLVIIEPALLPEKSTYPQRFKQLFTLVFLLGLLLGIIKLLIATIKDHY